MNYFCSNFGQLFSLNRIEKLQEIGLYLNDLNKFDCSAEILVTELQHNDQLQKAIDVVSKNCIFLPDL